MQRVAHGRDCGDADLKTAAWDADGVIVIPPRTLADVFDELAEVSLDPRRSSTHRRALRRTGRRRLPDPAHLRGRTRTGRPPEPSAARAPAEPRAPPQRVGEGISGKVAETGRATFIPVSHRMPVHRRAAAPVTDDGALDRRRADARARSRRRDADRRTRWRLRPADRRRRGDVIRLADRAALMFDNARLPDRQLAEHQRADERIRFQAGLLEQIDTAVIALDDHRAAPSSTRPPSGSSATRATRSSAAASSTCSPRRDRTRSSPRSAT